MVPVNPVLFYILSAVLIISAVLVVKVRNIFYAALSLGIVFFAVAGFYITLKAEFLAGMQILVYVGAIIILILFAIMLTQGIHRWEKAASFQGLALTAVLLLAALMGMIIICHRPPSPSDSTFMIPGNTENLTSMIGLALMKDYALPFEILSILLLAALMGAIAITKKEEKEPHDRA
jgi:NADH:ubiquinone oxidoreductase subunit 6 (subunit J)